MRNKRKTAIVFCSIMLLGGCGNAGTGVVETALEPRAQETETAQSDNSAETDGVREVPAQIAGNTAADVVVAEAGPDKPLYDTGNLIYKLYGFQLYESPEEAAIAQDAIKIEDAREYMDKSKFLTMQAEIQNIDYPGDESDGDAVSCNPLVREPGDIRLTVVTAVYDGSVAVVEFTLEGVQEVREVICGQLYNESKGADDGNLPAAGRRDNHLVFAFNRLVDMETVESIVVNETVYVFK